MSTLEEAVMSGEIVTTGAEAALFQADTPEGVLAEARAIAQVLKPALVTGGMTMDIGESEHVKIEGWQTLGSMLRVTPHIVWTRQLAEPLDGWEARAEIRTLDGRVISAAEAMCDRSESNWPRTGRNAKSEQAVRSMAQTRAQSKAFQGPLRFIVTLAGFSGVPAEDMGAEVSYGKPASPRDIENMQRAALLIYDGDIEAVETLTDRLARDAKGYIPRIVARAVQLVAARRPGAAVPDPVAAQDAADAEAEVRDGHVEPEVADPTAIEPEDAVVVEEDEPDPQTSD